MTRFRNFADAGAQLETVLHAEVGDVGTWVWCPIAPNGVAVLAGMQVQDIPVAPLIVERSDDGAVVLPPPPELIEGRCAIVVDDGVETGTVARAAAGVLRELRPATLILAVPVCSREAMADLQHRYDRIVAVDRPLVRRDLRWHYEEMGSGPVNHLT